MAFGYPQQGQRKIFLWQASLLLNLQILELRCKRALSRLTIKQFDPDEKLYCIGWQFRVKKLVDGNFDQKHLYKSQNQGIVFLPNR